VKDAAAELQLSQRIARGDAPAFETLMRRHHRMLFRAARAILRDDDEAEDAVQDAWLRAYLGIGTFRGEAKLSTWLVRIAANEALVRRRKARRRPEMVPLRVEEPGHQGQADTAWRDGPADRAERSEMRALLEASIRALPEDFRAVFMLRAVQELSVEETAEALGLPPDTVKTRLFRARRRLRRAMTAA
jgi:RNA polymerase sigma-70 factor (ECF subfamily)